LETYPECVLRLQSQEGFIDEYLNEVKWHDRYRDAYETIEKVYEQFFGKRRFENYESFRVILSLYLKR
jgi:hypothetical protein